MQNTLKTRTQNSVQGYVSIWLALTLIYYIPSFFFIQFETSSLAVGVFISATLVAALSFKPKYIKTVNKNGLIYFFLISALLITSSLFIFYSTENKKPLAAFIFIPIIISSYFFSRRITDTPTPAITKAFFYFITTTLTLGWISYFNLSDFGGYAIRAKPVPPFSEESHYALCIGFVAGAYTLVCNLKQAFFIALNILAQAILLPNLTLLVFFSLIILILFARSNPKYFLATSIALAFTLYSSISFVILNNEYFSSRLAFNETDNLTTLVWLQGWDLARINIINTYGLGLGFQMLGSESTTLSSYSYLAEEIAGQYKNTQDGGFLAAKVCAELGVIGLLIVAAYILQLTRFIKTLNSNEKTPSLFHTTKKIRNFNLKKLLFQSLLFFFLVEFFLRGYGYFSPSLYLIFASLFALKNKNLRHENN